LPPKGRGPSNSRLQWSRFSKGWTRRCFARCEPSFWCGKPHEQERDDRQRPPINARLVRDLANGGFIEMRRNAMLIGGTGNGQDASGHRPQLHPHGEALFVGMTEAPNRAASAGPRPRFYTIGLCFRFVGSKGDRRRQPAPLHPERIPSVLFKGRWYYKPRRRGPSLPAPPRAIKASGFDRRPSFPSP
jgi:hypothetical protein